MKKIWSCFILILLCCVMTGCASIDYRRIYTSAGSIIDQVNITLDSDRFTNATSEALYGSIKTDVDIYSKAIDKWIEDNLGGKYILDASLEADFKENINVRITERRQNADGYTFSIYIEFTSIEYYIYFYGLNTPEILTKYGIVEIEGVSGFDIADYGQFIKEIINGDYNVREDGWLTKKLVFEGNNILENFATIDKTSEQTYLEYYVNRVNALLDNAYTTDEVLENVSITQTFETNDNRFKSNADKVYRDPELMGYTIHEWNLNNLGSKSMEIYRLSPVRAWWYFIGLGVAGISLVYMFIRNKNVESKKEKGDKVDG